MVLVVMVFGDFDTGETRSFGVTERCILPIEPIAIHGAPTELASEGGDTWRCVQAGHAAPVQFNVRLWESDSSWEFWEWACFRRDGSLPPANCPDDLIGEFTQTFTENELLFALPQVGMWLEATKTLGSACGDNVCGGPGPTGREYTFTYRVTRMNDYRPVLAPPGLIAIEPCGAQELQYLMPYSRGTGIARAVNVVAGGSAPKRAFGRTWRPWFGTNRPCDQGHCRRRAVCRPGDGAAPQPGRPSCRGPRRAAPQRGVTP
jgi:hypothetical protein